MTERRDPDQQRDVASTPPAIHDPAHRPSHTALRVAVAAGAVAGLVYAGALDAGHLSLGYVAWGALLAALLVGLVRAARGLYRRRGG